MPVPAPLTRRQVLQTASLLGISAVSLSIPSDAVAFESPDHSLSPQSGLVTKQLKPLKYEEIPGLLTKSQVTPHYQAHYGGALKRFVTLDQQLDTLYKGGVFWLATWSMASCTMSPAISTKLAYCGSDSR